MDCLYSWQKIIKQSCIRNETRMLSVFVSMQINKNKNFFYGLKMFLPSLIGFIVLIYPPTPHHTPPQKKERKKTSLYKSWSQVYVQATMEGQIFT